MKLVLTGSTGNVSKPLALDLIAKGHDVTIITTQQDKAATIQESGAKAAVGSISDLKFLSAAFAGADAVYTMTPPNYGAPDYRSYMAGIGRDYANAISASGVKRVVNLSSIGAHLQDGTGPIKGIHDVEKILNELAGVAILHVRAGFFYTNLYANIDMIKHAGIIGSNYDAATRLVMVHPDDIARKISENLTRPFNGKSFTYAASDIRTAKEVAATLGKAIGKPDLQWVKFTDEQSLQGMLQAGMTGEIASNFVEMGTATGSGILFEDFHKQDVSLGQIKLEQFAEEFALAYNL